jgi:triphosphoribosyl-dephospho-CoA synthase
VAVARRARAVVRAGGFGTSKGLAAARRLDRTLRQNGNRLNPGTSADLVAAALFVWLLDAPARGRPVGRRRRAPSLRAERSRRHR